MVEELIIAGFGGQGVMSMGQLLAYGAMEEGKHVSWLPSYGPEQRGGTANVSVVISPQAVGSPVIDFPTSAIVLNTPSFERFAPLVRSGGKMFIQSDLVDCTTQREDIHCYSIPASSIAEKLGNQRVAGTVLLGAFIEKTGILSKGSLTAALNQVFGEKKKHLLPLNIAALEAGQRYICDF
ncbi:2-oxoglutarate ferredoxin oxidoreductase subunit gamma [Evansella caseinilytica]|uniref:2-oxoglutarate ferredoxin oxidoreductase subunit gamma n=1 Tax=Evansella caseinilytica TaxID=1503961 RepID=A0A1H3NAC8_9BACI|nr:2-oxoacid:acceptor oxidoreductase family protein [Evansella caseinilytica]SDY85842.1 2-oxoglutarate ferredoxin oxidoreductase subunit gamma [Evansella caseinilytica]